MNSLCDCKYAAQLAAADGYSVATAALSPAVFVGLDTKDLCETVIN